MSDQRKYVGVGLFLLLVGGGYFTFFSGGLPILWGPTASAAEIAAGKELFEHEWRPNDPLAKGDGLGPVFNAKSCVACHFQGGAGGGGEVQHNAVNYEVLPRPRDPQMHVGTVHNFSVDGKSRETFAALRRMYPVLKGEQAPPPPPSPDPHCGYVQPPPKPDFDPVRTESVNTTALFGAGWIDLISDKAILLNARTRALHNVAREMALDFTDIPVGKVRLLPDGRVGKFGWRGQFATLEEFVAAACANEIGLGTPLTKQPKPLMLPTAADVPADLDRKQFRSLVSFVKTLPKPVEAGSAEATRGKEVFATVGCAACHVPDMGGVTGVYSDFLLYTLDDPTPPGGPDPYGPPPSPDLPRPSDLPRPEEWKTPPLWGVADSAPYMHDGRSATLHDAIRRHRGEARGVSEAFAKLPPADQAAVIAFLKSLRAPADAPTVTNPATRQIARR
jgi:CxxC motif-containing protein (DUF1111 family)